MQGISTGKQFVFAEFVISSVGMVLEDAGYGSFAIPGFNKVGRYTLNPIQIQNEFVQQVRVGLFLGDDLRRNHAISWRKITK